MEYFTKEQLIQAINEHESLITAHPMNGPVDTYHGQEIIAYTRTFPTVDDTSPQTVAEHIVAEAIQTHSTRVHLFKIEPFILGDKTVGLKIRYGISSDIDDGDDDVS